MFAALEAQRFEGREGNTLRLNVSSVCSTYMKLEVAAKKRLERIRGEFALLVVEFQSEWNRSPLQAQRLPANLFVTGEAFGSN